MKSRIIAGAFAVVALLGVSVTAQAKDAAPEAKAAYTVPANSVNTAAIQTGAVDTFKIKDKSIGGWDVLDNTLAWPKFGSDFRNEIRSFQTKSNNAAAKADAAKTTADSALAKANEALAKPDNSTPTTVTKSCDPVVVAHTGGSFKTGKTLICSFDLPAGKWMINTSAFFARTAAGATGVRPQLALRVGSTDTAFGADYGTILGQEISATKDRELTGATVKIVDQADASTVDVFGFGYQDDTGDTDGGKIAASAEVVAVKVG